MGPYSFFVPPVKFCILRVLSILELLLSCPKLESATIVASCSIGFDAFSDHIIFDTLLFKMIKEFLIPSNNVDSTSAV